MKIKKIVTSIVSLAFISTVIPYNAIPDSAVLNNKQIVEASEVGTYSSWQEAYRGLYNNKYANNTEAKFCLAYIDNDDIPELLVAEGSYHATGVAIYGYVNGEVVSYNDNASYGSYGCVLYGEKTGNIVSTFIGAGGDDIATEGDISIHKLSNGKMSLSEEYIYTLDSSNVKHYYDSTSKEVTFDEWKKLLSNYGLNISSVDDLDNTDTSVNVGINKVSYDYNMYSFTEENINKYMPINDGIFKKNVTATNNTGKCGNNATWSYDDTTNTLTISGTGAMYDYEDSFLDVSWFTESGLNDLDVSKIVIKDGITSIGTWAFSSFSNVKSIELPNSLTKIGDYAFKTFNTENLKSITIPSSVTSIGKQAIGYYVQSYNDANGDAQSKDVLVTGFTINGYAGSQAETYAKNNGITFNNLSTTSTTTTSSNIATNGKCGDNATWSYDDATNTLTISGTGATYDYTFDNTLDNDGSFHDYKSDMVIKKIVVKDGITSIGNYLFFVHGELEPLYYVESIVLPDTLTSIGEWSIAGFTKNLKDINIPNNLKKISDYAFVRWSDGTPANTLCNMTIPKSVQTIGTKALGYIGGDGGSWYLDEDFVINGYAGSQAETYAKNNGITFNNLSTTSTTTTKTTSVTTKTTTKVTSTTNDINTSNAEKAVQILMDNKSVWNTLIDGDDDNATRGVTFLDIDLDGTPELVVYNVQGTIKDTYMEVFKIDIKNQKVTKVENALPYSVINNVGYSVDIGLRDIKLYTAIKDCGEMYTKGDTFYLGTDENHGSFDYVEEATMKFGGDLGFNQVGVFNTITDKGTKTHYQRAFGTDTDLWVQDDGDEKSYYDGLQDLNLTYQYVDVKNIDKESLIKSYNAFSYGKSSTTTTTTLDSGKTVTSTTTPNDINSPGTGSKSVAPLLLASILTGITAIVTKRKHR